MKPAPLRSTLRSNLSIPSFHHISVKTARPGITLLHPSSHLQLTSTSNHPTCSSYHCSHCSLSRSLPRVLELQMEARSPASSSNTSAHSPTPVRAPTRSYFAGELTHQVSMALLSSTRMSPSSTRTRKRTGSTRPASAWPMTGRSRTAGTAGPASSSASRCVRGPREKGLTACERDCQGKPDLAHGQGQLAKELLRAYPVYHQSGRHPMSNGESAFQRVQHHRLGLPVRLRQCGGVWAVLQVRFAA